MAFSNFKRSYIMTDKYIVDNFNVNLFKLCMEEALGRYINGNYYNPSDMAGSRGRWAACVRQTCKENPILLYLFGRSKRWSQPLYTNSYAAIPPKLHDIIDQVLKPLREILEKSYVAEPVYTKSPFLVPFVGNYMKKAIPMSSLINQEDQDFFNEIYNNNYVRDSELDELSKVLNQEIKLLNETQTLIQNSLLQLEAL